MLRQRRVKLKKWRLQKTHGRGKSEDTRLHHGRYISMSAEETERLGVAFARTLRGGEVLLLEGELGTGKTTFVRGLARALGIRRPVRSPTFTLLHVYPIRKRGSKIKQLIHVDAYRLKSAADLRALGMEEYLGRQDTVVAIEWGKKARSIIRKKCLVIQLLHAGTNKRTIYVSR